MRTDESPVQQAPEDEVIYMNKEYDDDLGPAGYSDAGGDTY